MQKIKMDVLRHGDGTRPHNPIAVTDVALEYFEKLRAIKSDTGAETAKKSY